MVKPLRSIIGSSSQANVEFVVVRGRRRATAVPRDVDQSQTAVTM